MVNIIINRQKVCVPEGTTILEAAKKIGINIPTLCYLKGINEIGACRVCIVEVAGTSRLVTSCNTPVTEGMEVFTNSARVREARKTNVELILSQHHTNCPTCVRSGNCKLQKVANDLNLVTDEYPIHYAKTRWTTTFHALRPDLRQDSESECVGCSEYRVPYDSGCIQGKGNQGFRLFPLRPVHHPLSHRCPSGER